jgi:hypothetical protein
MNKYIFFVWLFLFCFVKPISAITDPLSVANNRFGIHVLNLTDLDSAANLVNSTNGQWGYVTLVIRQNDLNLDKWQSILNRCRELKLIPIVRLATSPQDDYWVKPDLTQLSHWADFLNSLNWVIQNRYIVLFNEPNHAKEWGNTINPQEYAQTARAFHDALKQKSADFFILPAGFDTAAPNSKSTMSALNYWQQMYESDPQIFTLFDGWNSHSYPNPGFSGPLSGTGLGSLKSYQSELSLLSNYGLPQNLPVFITETGWIHKDGKVLGATTNPTQALSDFYQSAFTSIWLEPNLVAITPFILNYSEPPFAQFAWQIPNSTNFYPHYYAVKDLNKTPGNPTQLHQAQLISITTPDQLIDSSKYQLNLSFKNTGQSIWNQEDFFLKVSGDHQPDSITVSPVNPTKPKQTLDFNLIYQTPLKPSTVNLTFQLYHLLTPFGDKIEKQIEIIAPPSLIVKAKRLFFKDSRPTDYKLVIYNQDQQVLKEETISLTNQSSQAIKLYNLIPHQVYRFVLIKPFYLPRQTVKELDPISTEVTFKPLLPFDFNQDGHFSLKDLIPWFK